MKYQVLISLKNNEKYLWMSSAAVVTGALRVKIVKVLRIYCGRPSSVIL